MTSINYVEGDATLPVGDGKKIIAHVCNDLGRWGSGFVVALGRRYPFAKSTYIMWSKGRCPNGGPYDLPFELGNVDFASTGWGKHDVLVANMVAQHDVVRKNGITPIRYDALSKCLKTVFQYASQNGYSVHMPRIGCGLAGGEWNKIEPLILEANVFDIQVYVYDWNGGGVEQVSWKS